MNKITFVALNRAEGPTRECKAVVYYRGTEAPVITDSHFKGAEMRPVDANNKNDLASLVNGQIQKWGRSAPKDGGYDKTDFLVTWEGEDTSYFGRFDMAFGGVEDGKSFWESLKYRIEFYALMHRPDWMTDKNWSDCQERGQDNKKEAEEMLASCEFPL